MYGSNDWVIIDDVNNTTRMSKSFTIYENYPPDKKTPITCNLPSKPQIKPAENLMEISMLELPATFGELDRSRPLPKPPLPELPSPQSRIQTMCRRRGARSRVLSTRFSVDGLDGVLFRMKNALMH